MRHRPHLDGHGDVGALPEGHRDLPERRGLCGGVQSGLQLGTGLDIDVGASVALGVDAG